MQKELYLQELAKKMRHQMATNRKEAGVKALLKAHVALRKKIEQNGAILGREAEKKEYFEVSCELDRQMLSIHKEIRKTYPNANVDVSMVLRYLGDSYLEQIMLFDLEGESVALLYEEAV